MKFDIAATKIVRIRKSNFFEIKNLPVFLNDEYQLFAIANIYYSWVVIHIPSERILTSCFTSKVDVEEFIEILSRQTDLKSLAFFDFDFKNVSSEIRYDIEIAYRKFCSLRKLAAE